MVARVYSALDLGKAEELVRLLNNAGIDSYVVDYSKRTPGSKIGLSLHEVPTVFIVNRAQIGEAAGVVRKFDPSVAKHDDSFRAMGITSKQVYAAIIAILVVAIVGGLLW